MVGNVPVSPALDTEANLLKECAETGIKLVEAHEHHIIVFQSGKSKQKQVIQLNDVYAVVQNGLEVKLESCPRVVKHHWNPFRKSDQPPNNPYKRECATHTIRFTTESEAHEWYGMIKEHITPAYTLPRFPGGQPRKLLVVVNPIGGKGHGQEMFHELLKPMLTDAGTQHEMIVTTGPGHAGRIAQTFDLAEVGAIAVVGGDGLFGEVLNGLNNRPDRNVALKIPIGIIPAGSSNCLACSVGLRQPLAAAFSVAKGVIKPLDVLKITMNDEKKVILSVCGVSYGFISEVNTHAGKWRWLFGPMRYSVCGFRTFLASPLAYHVDCRYKPPSDDTDPLFDTTECGPDCEACARNWLKKSRAPSHTGTPTQVDRSYLGSEEPSPMNSSMSAPEVENENEDWKESSVVLEQKRRKFKKVDSKTMLLFSITNLSIRQSQNKTVWNANCHMSSGYMDLVMIPVISRYQLLKFFSQFNKGGNHHKKSEVFSVIKAKSVEMKISAKDEELPEWERKIQIAIDGEVFPLQPLRIDTIHGMLNLMCT